MTFMRTAGAVLVSFALAATAAQATLEAPGDSVVLTVSGAISVTNGDGTATFDLAMLESLGTSEVRTTTIWTEGEQVFEAVPLATILDAVGAEGSELRALAINDYQVSIPVADITDTAPLVAIRLNGAEMSVRDKGPLWVIYPFDSDESYRNEIAYTRSIWQLDRIEVVN